MTLAIMLAELARDWFVTLSGDTLTITRNGRLYVYRGTLVSCVGRAYAGEKGDL